MSTELQRHEQQPPNGCLHFSCSPSFRPRHQPPDSEGIWFARSLLGVCRLLRVERRGERLGAVHPGFERWEPFDFPYDKEWDAVQAWYGPVIPADFDPWANKQLSNI